MRVATQRRDVGTISTILVVIACVLACAPVSASHLTFRIESNSTLRVALCLQVAYRPFGLVVSEGRGAVCNTLRLFYLIPIRKLFTDRLSPKTLTRYE
jgi:hypothetical protein